jgi:hypothetical protein
MFLVPLASGDLPHPEDWAMAPWRKAASRKKKNDRACIAHECLEVGGTLTTKERLDEAHFIRLWHGSSDFPYTQLEEQTGTARAAPRAWTDGVG